MYNQANAHYAWLEGAQICVAWVEIDNFARKIVNRL